MNNNMPAKAIARRLTTWCWILTGMVFFVRCAQASADGPPITDTWGLQFADEFSGTTLDSMKWNYNYSWGQTSDNQAFMDQSQVAVQNGDLVLTAIYQHDPNAPATTTSNGRVFNLDYTSGAINSSGKFNMTYGYYEASMKTSSVEGVSPAFWMRQSDLLPPEIDIAQATICPSAGLTVSSYQVALYYGLDWQHVNCQGESVNTKTDLTAEFHTYGVDWRENRMTFYLDGVRQYDIASTAHIAQCSQMYMIINLGVGGFAGTPPNNNAFPAACQVDWVRVWQKNNELYPNSAAWTKSANGSWDDETAWSTGTVPLLNTQIETFGKVNAANVTVDWTNSRTAGGLVFNSSTDYTLGSANASLMLDNDNGAGTALIDATGASGISPNTIASRLDLHSDVTIRSPNKPLTINGAITGPAGLQIESGQITLNGAANYDGATTVEGGVLIMNDADISLGSVRITGGSLKVNSLSATMHDITGSGALFVGDGSTAAVLSADSITIGTVTIAPGSRVIINPIPGGPASGALQPVPEPSAWSLIMLTAAGALFRGCRRK
jgi:autotransporter-associated beta strand protein